jgi:hypothetical protein
MKWLLRRITNRCLTYDEFLQAPASFVNDVIGIIGAKERWGLDLTNDEKTLKNHITRMRIEVLSEHLNSTTRKNQ